MRVAGRYHLFYQWNPLACDHTYKCWGHWSSADLLHWRHEPIALMPDEEYDRNGCYSGSAVEFEGALTLCYTGNVKFPDGGRTARQCLATQNADGTFRKLGPVLPLPEGYTGHVRDPKVWRQDGRCTWFLGRRMCNSGKVLLLYRQRPAGVAPVGEIAGHDVNGPANAGYMWECPDLSAGGHPPADLLPAGWPAKRSAFSIPIRRCGWQAASTPNTDLRPRPAARAGQRI